MKLTTMFTNKEKMKTLALCLVAMYGALLLPMDAMASSTVGSVLCTVAGLATGTLGQGIATIAIIVIGVGALMGKVSWGMAIIVGIGIGIIFGAPAIVSEIGAGVDGAGCDA